VLRFAIFVYSLGVLFATVTLDTSQIIPFVSTATHPPLYAIWWRLTACFVALYLPVKYTEGTTRYPDGFRARYAMPRSKVFAGRCIRRVRSWLHAQEHAVPFDGGFVELDSVDEEAGTGRSIRAGEHVETFQFVYASFFASVAHALLEAIDAMTQIEFQNPCLCNQESRGPFRRRPQREMPLSFQPN